MREEKRRKGRAGELAYIACRTEAFGHRSSVRGRRAAAQVASTSRLHFQISANTPALRATRRVRPLPDAVLDHQSTRQAWVGVSFRPDQQKRSVSTELSTRRSAPLIGCAVAQLCAFGPPCSEGEEAHRP